MTIEEVYQYYIHVLGKYQTAGVEGEEFSKLFNLAQLSVLKDQTYNHNKGKEGVSQMYGWEMTQYMNEKWYTLIHVVEAKTDNKGKLPFTEILKSDELKGRSIYHFDGILVGSDENYARWCRLNDLGTTLKNFFKKPSLKNPIYLGYNTFIQVRPKEEHDVVCTFMVYPRNVNYDQDDPSNNIDPELTDSAIVDVIFRVLQLQGINIREQQFYEMTNMEQIKQ